VQYSTDFAFQVFYETPNATIPSHCLSSMASQTVREFVSHIDNEAVQLSLIIGLISQHSRQAKRREWENGTDAHVGRFFGGTYQCRPQTGLASKTLRQYATMGERNQTHDRKRSE